jgi:hypothetical protein
MIRYRAFNTSKSGFCLFVILSAVQRSETKSKGLSPFAFGQRHREDNVKWFDPFDFARARLSLSMTIVLIALSDPQ